MAEASTANPAGPSRARPVTLQAAASPTAAPVPVRLKMEVRPRAIRTDPSSASAEKVVRKPSAPQKCESWMPRGQNAMSDAAQRAVPRRPKRRASR